MTYGTGTSNRALATALGGILERLVAHLVPADYSAIQEAVTRLEGWPDDGGGEDSPYCGGCGADLRAESHKFGCDIEEG